MQNANFQALPGKKTEQKATATITTEDIYEKLLELEKRLKNIEEKLGKPLIG